MADMNSVDCYEGGIPNQGFDGTFPKTAAQGTMFKPQPGPAEEDSTAGSPSNGSGKSSDGGFVMKEGKAYDGPGDMEPGAMKTVDLDDIKNTV